MDTQAGYCLLKLLDVERIDDDLFRGTVVFDDPRPLYGGQVLAQALRAAGLTVPSDRLPHSLTVTSCAPATPRDRRCCGSTATEMAAPTPAAA